MAEQSPHVSLTVDPSATLAGIGAVQAWGDLPQAVTRALNFLQSLNYEKPSDRAAGFELLELLSAKMLSLYRDFPDEGRTSFSAISLVVPPLYANWGFEPSNRAAWADLKNAIQGEALASELVPMLRALVVEGVADGVDAALARFLERLCKDGFSERLKPASLAPEALGKLLEQSGWYVAGSPAVRNAMANALEAHFARGAEAYVAFGKFLIDVLAYDMNSRDAWLDFVTQEGLIPMIRAAGRDPRLADFALRIERVVYMALLKKVDTAENWKRTYDGMGPALAEAGRRYGAARYGAAQDLKLPAADGGPRRIAFFVWGDFSTAHVQMVYLMARGLKQLPHSPIDVFVYVLEGPGKNLNYLLRELDGLGVYVRHPEATMDFSTPAVDWLRACSVNDRISAVVFVSVTLMMCFAAGARIAPTHIYWSLKYHSLFIRELEGYLGTALLQHRPTAFGPRWRISDAAIPFRFDPGLSAEASAIRAKFGAPKSVILGCLGRADKLRHPAYIKLLGRLLRTHPNAVYLWTGRTQLPDLVEMMRAEGILERCHFIGWVNVRLYAQVLDIKIDSFPFASGHTCVETMAAGTPVLTLLTPESLESSTATSFMPLWEGRIGTPADHAVMRAMFSDEIGKTFAPFFETIEAYEAFAHRLIADEAFRRRVGAACRQFVEKFLGDERRVGATMAEQILAIIDESRTRAA